MNMSAYIAEFFGTMLLVLLGNGCIAHVILKKSKGHGSGWIIIAAGWGAAVALSVYIVGPISGAHINPAVTLALAVGGSLPWAALPGYMLAQLLGAMLGAFLVYITYHEQLIAEDDSEIILAAFSTGPSIRNSFWNICSEAVGTAVLLLGVVGISNWVTDSALTPMLIGMLVFGIGLSLGGATGYAINPARDLGPRIVHAILRLPNKGKSDWHYGLIVPILGPFIGGVAGLLLAKYIISL